MGRGFARDARRLAARQSRQSLTVALEFASNRVQIQSGSNPARVPGTKDRGSPDRESRPQQSCERQSFDCAMRLARWILAGALIAASGYAVQRVARVHAGRDAIPIYPQAREGPQHSRYWPRLLSWDDRSSARVDRIFALPAGTTLLAVARAAASELGRQNWYLITPSDLLGTHDPQVIVWQRDPDERLDLSQLWPMAGLTREQRLYGGRFPAKFLDEPMVIGWTWSLDGPRSPHPPSAPPRPLVRQP